MQAVTFHSKYHSRPWIQEPGSATDDSAAIRCCWKMTASLMQHQLTHIHRCRHASCVLLSRALQRIYYPSSINDYNLIAFSRRAIHSAIFETIGAIDLVISALLPARSYSELYGSLIVAASGAFSCIPPLLGWLSSNVFNTGAVGLAIVLNTPVGAPGQITGVWIYKADQAKEGYPTGYWVNLGCCSLWLWGAWV